MGWDGICFSLAELPLLQHDMLFPRRKCDVPERFPHVQDLVLRLRRRLGVSLQQTRVCRHDQRGAEQRVNVLTYVRIIGGFCDFLFDDNRHSE